MYNNRRYEHESFDEYFVRIGDAARRHEITWIEAADYLNAASGECLGECAYRKKYKAFYAGMLFERDHRVKNINTRILSISDLHIPFHKPTSVFDKYAGRVDILQLNGDIIDCQALSRFPKVYRKSPMEEILIAREYIIELIERIEPRKVVVNYGNHDIRFQNYLAKNLDSDILELMPKTALELILIDGFNHYNKELHTKVHYDALCDVFNGSVEIVYNDAWYSVIGDVIFCHPLAYSSGIMATSEKARRFFKDEGYEFGCLVMAHAVHDLAGANAILSTYPELKTMLINAETLNQYRDAIIAIETYYKYQYETYLANTTKQIIINQNQPSGQLKDDIWLEIIS